MGMPSELRLRLILDCQKVIEADYSGIHIHLLYNKVRIDYGATKNDPYAIPGYPTTKEYRNLFKKLLLAAVNAQEDGKYSGKTKAIMALQEDINYNPCDFPSEIPDFETIIDAFVKHHGPISKYFFTGKGLWLMYQDSQIAEQVLRKMYKHRIPVLPVHDSFICPKQYSDILERSMVSAYRDVTGSRLTVTPYTVNIKQYDEWDRAKGNPDISDDDYYFDISLTQDESLIEHFIAIEGNQLYYDNENIAIDKILAPHKSIVTVPIRYIT
jgi:hypothetical protein